MTNVIAILILASGFSVALETKGGFVERSFENTPAGAEKFREFAEPLMQAEGKKFKICSVTMTTDSGAIMDWMLGEDLGPAMLSEKVFKDYAATHQAPIDSPTTAARACLHTFPFIRRAQ
jgi:hypothetical protein